MWICVWGCSCVQNLCSFLFFLPVCMLPMAAMRVGSMSHWQPAAAASSYTLRVTCHQRSQLWSNTAMVGLLWFGSWQAYKMVAHWPPPYSYSRISSSSETRRSLLGAQSNVRRVSFVLMCSIGSQPIPGMRASRGYLARMFPLMWLRGRGLRQPLSRVRRGLLTSLGLSWPRMWHGGHASLKGQT